MPGMEQLVAVLIWLCIGALFAWLIWWLISKFPIPEPFGTVIKVVFAVICILFILRLLTPLLPPLP